MLGEKSITQLFNTRAVVKLSKIARSFTRQILLPSPVIMLECSHAQAT